MEAPRTLKGEILGPLRQFWVEAPNYSRILAQDSAAALSGSVLHTLRAFHSANPVLYDYFLGLTAITLGSHLVREFSQPLNRLVHLGLRRARNVKVPK